MLKEQRRRGQERAAAARASLKRQREQLVHTGGGCEHVYLVLVCPGQPWNPCDLGYAVLAAF